MRLRVSENVSVWVHECVVSAHEVVHACVHECVHTNVIVGTFVSVCFDIVGTPNIVGTHCWDSCFLDSQPYEMQMEKFSAMVPTVLLCVIVCALVNFRLSQPFLGLLGS